MSKSSATAANFRWSLPRGRILRRILRDDPSQEYLVYIPSAGAADSPVLASVHGISRNAHEQAIVFAPYCERFGVVLVVPRYTPEQHSDYQRLGRLGRGARADQVLDKCLSEVSLLTGADTTQFNLFGYSGGAQFGHRYLMAHPHRVAKAVLVAAGWYTFPVHTQKFPYGIRPTRQLPDIVFNPEQFLHVPVDVFVGEHDRNTRNLRNTKRTVEQQGKDRLERGRNWVAAMQIAGDAYGIETAVTFTCVPNTDHSFLRFCRRGALVKRVFKSLFGVAIEPPQQANSELLDDLDLSARQLFSAHKKEIAVVTGKQS